MVWGIVRHYRIHIVNLLGVSLLQIIWEEKSFTLLQSLRFCNIQISISLLFHVGLIFFIVALT